MMPNAYCQFSLHKPSYDIQDTYMSDYVMGLLGAVKGTSQSYLPQQGTIDDIFQPALFKPSSVGSASVEDMYNNYKNSSLGEEFNEFMEAKGYFRSPVDAYEKKQLGGKTIAQVEKEVSNGDLVTRLAVNSDYMGKLQESPVEALYVMMHEDGHIHGVHDEAENDGYLQEFFEHKASEAEGLEKQMFTYLAGHAAERVNSYQKAA